MLRSLLRSSTQFILTKRKSIPTITTHFNFLHNSSSISKAQGDFNHISSSSTISYLINNCGLSPQSALSASQKINIESTEKPDSLLSLLKSYNFTNTQISNIITKYPQLLSFNSDATIKPKFNYFVSVGFSGSDLTTLISTTPQLLHRSLENRIKANFDLLKSIIGTNQLVIAAVRRCTRLLENNLETNFLPNVATLKSYGVPAPHIAQLAAKEARVLMQRPEQFKMAVESIRKMGFDPLSTSFARGIVGMSVISPSTWERKVELFKSFGWSEEETVTVFVKEPSVMHVSDEKLRRVMNFFVKKMRWGTGLLSKKPKMLKYSFEKRIIPRCSVITVLASKGLVGENPSVTFLTMNEEKFLDFYVTKYQDQVPEVLKAYTGSSELATKEGS